MVSTSNNPLDHIFFTSDCHFNHENLLSIRPEFKNIDELNNTLINNWNKVIKPGDRIYVLGDFIISPEKIDFENNILKKLNGQKYLILGNHDRMTTKVKEVYNRYFIWIKEYYKLKVNDIDNNKLRIILFHYPIEVWDVQHHSSYHFYGHIHKQCDHLKMSEEIPRRYNVSADANNYTPISLSKILNYLEIKNLNTDNYRELLKIKDNK